MLTFFIQSRFICQGPSVARHCIVLDAKDKRLSLRISQFDERVDRVERTCR